MKIFQGISGLSLLALLIVGCGGNNDLDKAPSPKPSVNKVAVPSPAKQTPAASVTKGLIATEPIKIPISQGRVDPFGAIAVAPIKLTQPQGQVPRNQQPAPQAKTQQPKLQQQAQQPKTQDQKIIRDVSKPVSSAIKPPASQKLSVPPATSSVEIAQAVQIKGVVELGGKVSAIVKEPDQSDSRAVNAGEYVAQGKVLVKRIEFNSNREPVVILEQNGVEVVKSV